MAGPSSVTLNPERYALGLLSFSFLLPGFADSDRHDASRLSARLRAFGFFASQRLAELGAWRESGDSLRLLLADHDDERSWDQLERDSTWDRIFIRAPHFTGRENDEDLVSSVAAVCEKMVRRLVPRARLGVLADEFLSAGSRCVMRLPMVGARTVTAQLEVRQGMRTFEAMLDVETKAGVTRHCVLAGDAGNTWDSLLGKLSVSSTRVVIRSWPGGLYLREGLRRHVFDTGNAATARRFVVEVGAEGRQRRAQEWELTGAGGRPIRRTRLVVKDAAFANAWLSRLRYGS